MAEAEAEIDSLENLLNLATNPLQEDTEEGQLDYTTRFCDQVNREFDGASDGVQLLVHKITSPQEKEALLGLTVLEVCVKNCGHKFHAEIGKFRFLNEMIKVISPKYLGNKRSEKVKQKCVELMYCWTRALPHETKIVEAYQMLKKQGIVKEDPTYMDKACDLLPVPKPRPKKAVFEDEDKSKLLARLLKSKHPEDLQAANRLIKNMVRQDAEKSERVSRRIRELDTVGNNTKLLVEMLDQYNPSSSTPSECDVMKELYEALEKHRPALFRLASDADEKDAGAMNQILEANDTVMKVLERYKTMFGVPDKTDSQTNSTTPQTNNTSTKPDALLDLGLEPPRPMPDRDQGFSLVASELESLGLGGNPQVAYTAQTNHAHNDVTQLDGLFTAMPHNQPPGSAVPPPGPAPDSPFRVLHAPPPVIKPTSTSPQTTQAAKAESPVPSSQSSALAELDFLGQSMLQQNIPDKQHLPFIPSSELNQKPSLNQIKQSQQTQDHQLVDLTAALDAHRGPLDAPLLGEEPLAPPPDARPALAVRHNPTIPGPPREETLNLTDVFVPLENIKPASVPSVTIYEKNCLKIVIHFGEGGPKPHILVMVVSTLSTHQQPIHDFVFQAAVPKSMRVKLQPPSASDLPAHNPFLPPTALTQVMLLANPQKEQIRLKFKIDYKIDSQTFTDSGDYEKFPVQ